MCRIYIYIYILLTLCFFVNLYHSQSLEADCSLESEHKKKFKCTINNVRDVNTFSCEAPPHTCRVTRDNHVTTSPDASDGTLTYFIDVTLKQYTTSPISVTVTERETSGTTKELAKTVSLQCGLEPNEIPRIECDNIVGKNNNFQSTVDCHIYVTTNTEELNTENGNQCIASSQHNSNSDSGFLFKRTFSVTIVDQEKTCNRDCQVHVKMKDSGSGGEEKSIPLSHTSTCSGENIDCTNHDDNLRTITCNIQIPYEFLQVDFKSTKTYVDLNENSKKYVSKSKNKETKVLTYVIKDYQSITKDFQIQYDVIQKSSTKTFTGKSSGTFTYVLKNTEIPKLECGVDNDKNRLEYYEKGYKCSAMSHTQSIQIQTDSNKYQIVSGTSTGNNNNNLFTHTTFDITVKANVIVCNEQETINLFFSDLSVKIKTDINQIINCRVPTISQESYNNDQRKITLKVSARYEFSLVSIVSDNDKIVVTIEPPANSVQKNNFNDMYEILIPVDYDSSDLSVKTRRFHIDLQLEHSREFKPKIKSNEYTWNRNPADSPKLICKLKDTEVPLDVKKFVVSCDAATVNEGFSLNSQPTKFTIIKSRVKKQKYKGIYKWKNYELVLEDQSLKCDESQEITLSYTDNEGELTQSIQRNPICQGELVVCSRHDPIARTIKCKFIIPYPYKEIAISTGITNVKILPNKIESSDMKIENEFTYTVTNPVDRTKDFALIFKIYQKNQRLTKTMTETFSFQKKRDESTQISCFNKDEPLQSTGTLKYTCNMISETSSLKIKIHPSTYLINPSTITASKVGSLYKVTNNEFSITPRTIKCGHHERIRISFTESTSEYETHVNHTTICREPIIKCEKHNIVDRIITCDFEIQYEFTEIKISVNEGAVKLDSTTISSSVFKDKILSNHQIKYTINDISVSTSQFHIIFQVIQSSGNVAHQKAIGLRYFVKSGEIPRIECRSTNKKQKITFQSQLYECDVVSRSAKVKLSTSDGAFTLSPTEVQGDFKNGIYIHKDFSLTVTTNNIKCDDKKDVKIVANDGENNLEFTVKHSNICSDLIINCNSHDYDKREITCDITVEFPFTSINLQSSLSTIVEIKNGNLITYNHQNTQKSFSHTILYEVTNWKHQDHQFNIQFSVMQDTVQVAILTKTFRYILKLSETPYLSCNQNRIKSLNEYSSIIYKCDLLSLSSPRTLVSDSANYPISDVTLNEEQSHEIYQLLNQEITIKPNSYICNKPSPVKISINAVGTQPEHTVIHQTTCPAIIRCDPQNLEEKEISCNVQIDFEFKEFQIKSTSPNIQISIKDDDATKISANSDGKYNAVVKIKYLITDYLSNNHNFEIIFDVILNDDSILFQIKRNFRYVLTENEIPHIKCIHSPDPSLKFYQAKFSCEIVSVNKEVKLEVIPKEYKIDQHSSNGNDHGALYENDGIDIIVEPVEITCDRREMIEIRFNDFGDVKHGEKFVHVTKCPDASINQVSHSQRDRKVTLKVEAEYQYTILNVISNTQSVALIPHIGQGSSVANKWKTLVTFEYRPEDWSVDSHKFRAIITVQQQNVGWESKILSEEYTFETSQEEKPKIFCSLGNTESNTDFSQKVFTCNAITRQSIMMLNLSDANYRIVSTKGSSVDYKHVYQWNNHEITIQDVAITCNTPKSVDIFFTEYTNMYKSPITMSITCPIPKITINSHDTEKRIIILHVDSELPTYTSEILYLEKLLTFTKTDSIIKRRGRKWNSIITMEYTLNDLLNDKFTIPFSLRIKQHLEMIGTVELQFDYTLHENEKRQITCGVNEELTEKQFAVTEYICYVVGTSSLAITLEPNSYKLSYDQTLPSRFVNIQRWENVSVRVQDTSIVCNKTVNITLTNKDGEDCFSTIVQHTTICDKIDGECVINQNDVTYIFCNFTSDTHFQLRNYSCSDAFNCSRSKDSDKISTKWNEFVFQLTPLSTDAYLEFDFHITLEHSIHSPVSFTFRLEYNIETAINLEVQKPPAAKIVTSFCNSLIFVAIFAVLLAYSLLRKIKNKIYVFEYPEKPSFRNL